MIKRNNEGRPYQVNDMVSYNGESYTLQLVKFKINSIESDSKSICVTACDSSAVTYYMFFWTSSYGKDPNIYKDESTYKLAEIKVGDTVDVLGFKYYYMNKPQFNPYGGYIISNEPLEYVAPILTGKLMNKINNMIDLLSYSGLKETCYELMNKYKEDFLTKPAAHSHHHNYLGGLLQHTYEVMQDVFIRSSELYSCDRDVVTVAALFHDIMKVYEYTLEGDYLPYGNMVGHIAGGAMEFTNIARKYNVHEDVIQSIQHCILAHHGRKDWGSPVEPMSAEAALLFTADLASARINPMMLTKKNNELNDYYDF